MATAQGSSMVEGLACMRQPSLIKQLKSVLDQYPKGQILKEMIQNAEDAGAREIKVLYEGRQCNRPEDLATLENPCHLKALQGPGLCVFNDAEFTEKDWKGIQMIQSSNKEQDRFKVGRYGLGFKSVFHVTDWLCIISGQWILFINPHQPKDEVCLLRRIAKLDTQTKDAVLSLFDGTFNFSKACLQKGTYRGTLFWFPLRQDKSDLSENVYRESDVLDLFKTFTAEAEMTLLFLKSLESISLLKRDDLTSAQTIFVVQIKEECLQNVRKQRKQFKSELDNTLDTLPPESFHSTSYISIECTNNESGQASSQEWIVVHLCKGGSISDQLTHLCADTELSYSPYVGAAYALSKTDHINGHVFCFLPLPLSAENTTGLPVHVNGFFALTQDRRGLKWSADEGKQDQWNHCLISEVIPEAYLILVNELKQYCVGKNNSPDVIDFFYGSLPDYRKIKGQWKDLMKPFYRLFFKMNGLFSKVSGGKWLHWNHVILAVYDADVAPEVCKTVTNTYTQYEQNVVLLPDHIMQLKKMPVPKVCPDVMCHLLKTSALYMNFTSDECMNLLKYALRSSHKSLEGLALLPVADGTFQKFSECQVFLCPEKVHLFPGLERRFVQEHLDIYIKQHLSQMAKKAYLNLREVSSTTFPALVRECFSQSFPHGAPVHLQRTSSRLGEQWLRELWSYAHELRVDMLSSFSDIPLIPEYRGETLILHSLTDLFIAESFPGFETLTEEISQCLQNLGVVVLSRIPDYIQVMFPIGTIIQCPTPQGVMKTLGRVSKQNIQHFNTTSEESIKTEFVKYLASCKSINPDAKTILRDLKLFRNTSSEGRNTSVADVNKIAPPEQIPVSYPSAYLYDQSSTTCRFAVQLGAKQISILEIICEVLDIMACSNMIQYSDNDVHIFMMFILENSHVYLNDIAVKQRASLVRFLPSNLSGILQKPTDLFDPRISLLQDLFYGEDKFPCEEFCQSEMTEALHKLGLKRDTHVTLEDICHSASVIEDVLDKSYQAERVIQKAQSILKVCEIFDPEDIRLSGLLSFTWMPVLTVRPSTYPKHLPFAGTGQCIVGRPQDLYNVSHLHLVGSVRCVSMDTLPIQMTYLFESPSEDDVVEHLKNVTDTYTADEHQTYMGLLNEIYQYFMTIQLSPKAQIKLAAMKVVWTGEEAEFVKADKIWINNSTSDINLTPYRYCLPNHLKCFANLFLLIAASKKQTSEMFMEVLHEIQEKHKNHNSVVCVSSDLELVMKILNVLKEDSSIDKNKILIPVHDPEERLLLMQVEECVYCDVYQPTEEEEEEVEDETQNTKFANISSHLATHLGIRILTNQLMDGTEILDMNFGQKEPLTTRLRNLLHEYTDGFSVPKEIIQNADDAGACEVNFLYDERENLDARTNLIHKEMASLQGPALWAQNDAQFSDSDFANITKLSGETKMNDTTKIGRFGLGFNSVYNLTDVPGFISRNNMVIFDPHQSYLGSPGMKADLTKKKNKAMLRKMKDQFKPFEGVFGCHLVLSSAETGYSGTLFRFPLRTPLQAQHSEISGLSYSPSEMKKFLQVFVSSAGNLLLFCQNVKTVRMYHLPKHMTDASKATLLIEVQKSVEKISRPLSGSVLKFLSDAWREKCNNQSIGSSDVVNEKISISLSVTKAAKEFCRMTPTLNTVKWTIAWVLGGKQSAQMAMENELRGLVPIAAAAVPICEKQSNTLFPLSNCPDGFYKEGHLFCFLPLPITIPLPLHINGAFALTHDRKQLCSRSEDEKYVSTEAEWNEVLKADAVTSAMVRVFEGLKTIGDVDAEGFYKLWPQCDMRDQNLFRTFYGMVVHENPEVLIYNGRWIPFKNAIFLDQKLRFAEEVGQVAFKAFEHYNKGQETLIDLPKTILKCFAAAGLSSQLKSHTLRMDVFYQETFFPNINDSYWNNEDRDGLIMFALQHGNSDVKNLIKVTPCIPTKPKGILKQPKDLVNPKGETACLFKDCDGIFPGFSTKLETYENAICSPELLKALSDLGMQNEELQWTVVHERVRSIETLFKENIKEGKERCKNILYYLGKTLLQWYNNKLDRKNRYMDCPHDTKEKIRNEAFLPVLTKPKDWPTVWHNNGTNTNLGSPPLMCFQDCKDISGSNKLILDSTFLDLNMTRDVLQWLGVQTKHDIPVSDIIEHLLTTSLSPVETLDHSAHKTLSIICSSVYEHLNSICSSKNTKENDYREHIFEMLHGKPVILQNTTFIRPEQMAFSLDYRLEPYLYKVSEMQISSFLQTIGVRKSFEPDDAAGIMMEIAQTCVSEPLSEIQLHCFEQAASLLVHLAQSKTPGCVGREFKSLYLPDKKAILRPFTDLCLDDCDWVNERSSMKFLHHCMPVKVAVSFGIKTKRQEHVSSHAVLFKNLQSFGQHEPLTNRLKRILEGYPCDSSLMKELLQNADDAGASELMFIKDFRTHPSNRIFDDRWKILQGPALVVYNNSYFTHKDLDGIQDLGLGSKGGDPLKTGQYGVGFNAVYHLTDVPTFLTVGPQTEETLCVLDPNCQYTPTAEPGIPGARYTNIPELRDSYRDVFSCFLEDKVKLLPQGTLFRFPLRTKDMATQSDICKAEMSTDKLEELLNSFKGDMAESLLFLHNVRKITVASINSSGDIEKEHVVEASTGAETSQKHDQFLNDLREQVKKARDENMGLTHLKQTQNVVTLKLKDSYKQDEEEWLVVHQFGFSTKHDLPQQLDEAWKRKDINLLPRGGVAARVDVDHAECDKKAFCILPLPIQTGLPVHINGHFALDHEARRNLWHGTRDYRSLWNTCMVEALIVPAYLSTLQEMQVMFEGLQNDRMQFCLKKYNTLFPNVIKAKEDIWKSLADVFYKSIFCNKLTLFPVLSCSDSISWVAVHVDRGFPGFFNDLECHFNDTDSRTHIPEDKQQHSGNILTSLRNVATNVSGMFTRSNETSHPISLSKAVKLAHLLKRIGMKVIEAPLWIYKNFQTSGLNDVQCVNPENVITFLKSCSSQEEGRCCVGELPQNIKCTPFVDTETVKFLITFCQKAESFASQIVGLPLCLSNSSMLNVFSRENPILVTLFTELISGSPHLCLHENIAHLFKDLTQCPALKKMDVNELSRLLHWTLDAAVFKQGVPVIWNNTQSQQPNRTWISKLWTFLLEELSEDTLSVSKFGDLMEWSLLPCTVTTENNNIANSTYINQLYPIKNAADVVNIQTMTNGKHDTALKTLGLPCLNLSPFRNNEKVHKFVSSMTANLQNPLSMLAAMSKHKYMDISPDTGYTLLEYFCNNLRAFESDQYQAIAMLKRLPFFATRLRSTMSLVSCVYPVFVKGYMPIDGLDVWSSQSGKTVFKYEDQLSGLYTFMKIDTLTIESFYSQHLLPQFKWLPTKAKAVHLKYIKDSLLPTRYCKNLKPDQTNLVGVLKKLPFIEKIDGTLCRASEFYSNMEIVFKVMCSPEDFPPVPYNDYEWHDFLVLAGMIDKVTVDLFVQFGKQVKRLGRKGITEDITKMSNTLVNHLFYRPDILKENLIPNIKHIRFVLPFRMKVEHRYGKEMDSICHQFENASHLIAFSGSVFFENCELVWSSCHVLPNYRDVDKRLLKQLGCQVPQKDDVVIHMKNISSSLKTKNNTAMKKIKTCLEKIMFKCYQFFKMNEVTQQDRQYLEAYPVIYLNDNDCMVRAKDVVITISPEDAISEYIYQAPLYFGQFFSVFESLGASKIVSANHYAEILSRVHSEIGKDKLNPNDLIVVQRAVNILFKCLSDTDSHYSAAISVSTLYLPSSLKTLVCANDLVFSNTLALQRRVESLGLIYFIGFDKLQIRNVFDPVGIICSLPDKYRPQILSSLVREHVTSECQEHAYIGSYSVMYLRCITSSPFVSGVIRLVNHQTNLNSYKAITRDDVILIEKTFEALKIYEVNHLRTNLVFTNSPVTGSEEKRKCFLEFLTERDEMILYIDKDACQSQENMCLMIAEKIDMMTRGKIGSKVIYIQNMLQIDGKDIVSYLDEHRILSFSFGLTQSEQSVFPPPGSLIPEEFHWKLDNNFEILHEGEYVGLEVYDPAIVQMENDEGMSNQDFSDGVYIYVIVKKCLTDQNVCPIMMKYLVDVGGGRIEEMIGTKLYKLCRKKGNAGQELVESNVLPNSPDVCNLDLKEILKEIRQTLKDAWSHLNEHDRHRVMKRLYLKWHPDKNHPSRTEICTQVCQYIQHYVTKLNNGESIDDNVEPCSPTYQPTYQPSSFFDNMDRRSRSQRTHYQSYQQQSRHRSYSPSGTYGFHSDTRDTSYPHPQEARRWLRQAQVDLETAKKALSNSLYDAFNWICFKSHQAAEKALKAMLYNQDAQLADRIKTHDLRSVVRDLNDSSSNNLVGLVNELENLVCDYKRMRYPDRLSFPQIPSDVYSKQTACETCRLASDIVEHAETHIR